MTRIKEKIYSPMWRYIYRTRPGIVESVFGDLESNKDLKQQP